MKTIKIFFPCCLLLILFGQTCHSQEKKLKRGEDKYQEYAFLDATQLFLEVAKMGHENVELQKKLGNSYYFNANYEEAARWYRPLTEAAEVLEPVYYLRYAQSLKATGEDEEAEMWFGQYLKQSGKTDSSYEIDFDELISENSGRYTIENLEINSTGVDFGAVRYKESLIFTSTRDTGTIRRTRSAWDGMSFLDLYITSANQHSPIKKLKGRVNGPLHESSPSFTSDGRTMYFTRNSDRSIDGEDIDTKGLKIYRARLINGKWKEVEDLPINSDAFSNAHPSLNKSGNMLYFSSDRPGGYGQTDIYAVELLHDGSFGEPRNLGPQINTIGRESFPFISENGIFFASDGHYGLGGLDLFYVELEDSLLGGSLESHLLDNLKRPINLGHPINSKGDDFAYTGAPNSKFGYFSSNRTGGKGKDDIYRFEEKVVAKDVFRADIVGKVVDRETGEALKDSEVSILDSENKVLSTTTTKSDGSYRMLVDRFLPVLVRVSHKDYEGDELYIENREQLQELNFQLRRNEIRVKRGEDLLEFLGIEPIHFVHNRAELRPDAMKELEKVVDLMKMHPQMKIAVQSHTDSSGSEAYNLALSERRAKATAQYLISLGIEVSRLTYKGFGETKPIFNCAADSCSREMEAQNRRSEFIVMDR